MCAWRIDPRIETVVISPEQVERAFKLLAVALDRAQGEIHGDIVWELETESLFKEVQDANYPKALDV